MEIEQADTAIEFPIMGYVLLHEDEEKKLEESGIPIRAIELNYPDTGFIGFDVVDTKFSIQIKISDLIPYLLKIGLIKDFEASAEKKK